MATAAAQIFRIVPAVVVLGLVVILAGSVLMYRWGRSSSVGSRLMGRFFVALVAVILGGAFVGAFVNSELMHLTAASGSSGGKIQTPSGAFWAGTKVVDSIGLYLDEAPAQEGSGDGREDIYDEDGVLHVNSGTQKIVVLNSGQPLNEASCRTVIHNAEAEASRDVPSPQLGAHYCFDTHQNKMVLMTIIENTSDGYRAQFLVWQ